MDAFVRRSLGANLEHPQRVAITQRGEMRLTPRGRWMPFTAAEVFAVDAVAFAWSARFRLAPGAALQVVDAFVNPEGIARVAFAGPFFAIPVAKSEGPEVAVAQALRYLSELMWVPHAMRYNDSLSWEPHDERNVDVGVVVAGNPVRLRLEFDEDGDLSGMFAAKRARSAGKETVATPWRGRVIEYGHVGGVRLPVRAEVGWELPDGPFVYWRGSVDSFTAIA